MNFRPMVQNGFIDPYVYTGYIHNFQDLLERYGPTYYSVRFGHILPARMLAALVGALPGYLLWRYLVVLAGSVPFYFLLRQRYGRPLAMALVAVLVTSPFLARTVLWDYPSATAVPCLLGAVCLLQVEHRRRRLLDLAAGFLAGLMIHSNVFGVAPLGVYVAAYGMAWVVSGRGFRILAGRLAWFSVGPIVLTAAGWLYYWSVLDRWDIWSSTVLIVTFLVDGGTTKWRTNDPTWVLREFAVLTPLFLTATALLASVGRRISIQAAALGSGAACAASLLYIHQFLLNGNTLELLNYFGFALPSVFLLLALTVAAIWERRSSRMKIASASVLVVCAAGPWILYSFDWPLLTIATVERHFLLAIVAGVLVVLARVLAPGRTIMPVLASAALGLTVFSSFAQPTYAGAINSRVHPEHTEENVYTVALQFIDTIPTVARHPGVIRFWYSDTSRFNSMWSIQSTFLWGYSRLQAEERGLPYLGEKELALLREPELKWLALLAEDDEQLELARAALTANGVRFQPSIQKVLAAGDYRLHVEILELQAFQ
ncbi:MAG TPA: hypothetical protein VFO67_12445 [Gemmatimonadales bacterium]|nr:hypothetical protein [Gemmatimonadales bacterium]